MAKKAKKAAADTETEASASGTGTGTETKTKAKAKVEVVVHEGLAELIKKHDEATGKAASFLVEMGELVERDHISNPVLIKTLVEVRGITPESAKSQASRLRRMLDDKETFAALKAGDVTLRAAVKGAQARRVPSAKSAAKKLDSAISAVVLAAKASGQDKKTLLATIEAAFDAAKIK